MGQPNQPGQVHDLSDDYATWLAECDDALAAGRAPTEPTSIKSVETLAVSPIHRQRDLVYLNLVRQVLRSSDRAVETSDGRRRFPIVDSEAGHLDDNATELSPVLSRQLGDFRIVREIGRGGMGTVYEAEQLSIGRRVAIKVLPRAGVLDPKQLQRFKNEVHIVGQLHHPHIVPIY